MKKAIWLIIFIFVALGILILANRTRIELPQGDINPAAENNVSNTQGADKPVGSSQNPPAPSSSTSVKSFNVVASNFKFSNNALLVKKGDRVRITLKNQEGRHDFVINEFNAATRVLNVGEEQTIEFIADKVGSFEFYCSVGSHRDMGMKGFLKIE